jgi:predicted nucleic acid-binding Zn ribbon protein
MMDSTPKRYAEDPGIQERRAEEYAKYGEGIGRYKRECYVCGKVFYPGLPHAALCSHRCNQIATLERRRERKRAERQRTCPRCGKTFTARKKDSVYCSNACRQAMHRKRRA